MRKRQSRRTRDQQLLEMLRLLEVGPMHQTAICDQVGLMTTAGKELLTLARNNGYIRRSNGLWEITEKGENARATLAVARKHIEEVMQNADQRE
jgi:predicted transcriptional regulator